MLWCFKKIPMKMLLRISKMLMVWVRLFVPAKIATMILQPEDQFLYKKKNKDHHSNKPKIMINYSLNFINFLGMIFIQLALTFLLSGSCSVQGCFLIIIHMQPDIFFITKFLLQRNITIKALNFHKFSYTNSQCRRKFAIIFSLDAKDFMNTTVLETSLYCLTLPTWHSGGQFLNSQIPIFVAFL